MSTLDLSGSRLPESARQAWADYSGDRPAHAYRDLLHRFEQSRSRYHTAAAVADEADMLTYDELGERSRAVAALLTASGVRPGDRVALIDDRDVGTYVFLLAIVRVNAVFVPLNRDEPVDRLSAVLTRSEVGWLLVRPGAARPEAGGTMRLEADWRTVAASDHDDPPRLAPDDLAYLIHTSGSTGVPKGVRISHRSLSNLVDWVLTECPIEPGDVVAQMSTLYFDPCIQQIFPAWSAGGCLIPVPLNLLLEPLDLIDWLRRRRIAHIDLVTPHWAGVLAALEAHGELAALPDLKWLLVGGESMYYEQVARWTAAVRGPWRLVNIYGPTEATVNASTMLVAADQAEGKVPIGFPLPGYRLFVVDRDGRLCNPYVVGELVIAGVGVAQGYTDPVRTAEMFVTDSSGTCAGLIYRTGDQARLVRDHHCRWTLEFRGRADDQVKIAGNRIELEEIDAALTRAPQVLEGAVAVVGEGTAKAILCLYVPEVGATSRVEANIRAHLAAHLPAYMVPSLFHPVDQLLYKDTGKLDRTGLVAHYLEARAEPQPAMAEPPSDRIGLAVWHSWTAALGRSALAEDDEFFACGGSSLLALEVAAKLRQSLGVPVRTVDLYRHPTFAEFAARMAALAEPPAVSASELTGTANPVRCDTIEQVEALLAGRRGGDVTDAVPMAVAPASLCLEGGIISVHMEITDADDDTIAAAVAHLVTRHPLLRSMPSRNGAACPERWVVPPSSVDLPVLQVAEIEPARRRLHGLAQQSSNPRPCRMVLLRDANRAALLLWLSHAVCDGEGQQTIQQELAAAISGQVLPAIEHDHDRYLQLLTARADEQALHLERERVTEFNTARWLFAAASPIKAPDSASAEHRQRVAADPIGTLAMALHTLAAARGVEALPVVVDFHGRIDPSAHTLVGAFSTYLPGVIRVVPTEPEATERQVRELLDELPRRYPAAGLVRPKTTVGAVRVSVFQESGSRPAAGIRVMEPLNPRVDGDGHVDVSIRVDDGGVELITSEPLLFTAGL